MPGDRAQALEAFLATCGWERADRVVLADDASFRRYDRLTLSGDHAVLMDAPPDKEDVRPFVAIASLLQNLGLSAPRVLAADVEQGFLLLEDLGDDTYTKVLAKGGDEYSLYALATDTLVALQSGFKPANQVPTYSPDLFLREVDLFVDWFWPAIHGNACPDHERAAFQGLWRNAISHAYAVPTSLVLRDYHVDNMIHLPGRADTAACGLLDFQDAVLGPVTYDLVSLLEDARRDVPTLLADGLKRRYLNAFPTLERDAFALSYAVLGAQRATKIIGIFTRLDRRDGKPRYLQHIPRTWRWLAGGLQHPLLRDLKAWYDGAFPEETRKAPPQVSRRL